MDRAVKESIEHFEFKKEFREVKLKTRKSFREDQVALERRLSKRKLENSMPNGGTNGDSKTNENDVLSNLESIVLDIGNEKDVVKERTSQSTGVLVTDSEEIRPRKKSVDNNIILDEVRETIQKDTGDRTQLGFTNGQSETHKVPHQNGYIVHQGNQNLNGSNVSYGLVPNGHTIVQNGHTPGATSLLMRPKVNVQPRATMTPEPRLKSLSGIYQKNPKLTASSTDHLDNISLRGVKPAGMSHGQKTAHQQVLVPTLPGAEVSSIPADGNLGDFSVEQMVTVFRLLKLPEELLYRLCKYKVDGKRFSVFTDKELTELGMNNPVVRYFRDRTAQKPKKKPQKFML